MTPLGLASSADPDDAVAIKIARVRNGAPPRVLDLFSGCGGFSLGFQEAGFSISAGIDIDPDAASSHAINFDGASHPATRQDRERFARDLTELEPEELVRSLGQDEPALAFDAVIGGPPCQSYARVGRAKLRQVAKDPNAYKVDPRGNLYLRYLHYVSLMRPLIIVMENVPDVLNYGGHNVAGETAEALEALGYVCRYTLLNAVFYGVPQMRERMVLVAYHRLLGAPVRFPSPSHFFRLPRGYAGSRNVALKSLASSEASMDPEHFVHPPDVSCEGLDSAITVKEAIDDLPPLIDHLRPDKPRRIPRLDHLLYYQNGEASAFAREMRQWPGYETRERVGGHVIRRLPRDYKIFRRMEPGDQYPEAKALAVRLFGEHVSRRRGTWREVLPGTTEYDDLWARFVPPYDETKFPNKWRKLAPDEPSRTLMAHLGKDTYSHIHYDGNQARTISVREAARLQSFPDGFQFVGGMNSAFRQIGNAVPPMFALKIARTIWKDVIVQLRSEKMGQAAE